MEQKKKALGTRLLIDVFVRGYGREVHLKEKKMKRCMHQGGMSCKVYGRLKDCPECDVYMPYDYFETNDDEIDDEEEKKARAKINNKIKEIEMKICGTSPEIEDRQKLLNKFNELLECVKIFETMLKDIIEKEWIKDDKS